MIRVKHIVVLVVAIAVSAVVGAPASVQYAKRTTGELTGASTVQTVPSSNRLGLSEQQQGGTEAAFYNQITKKLKSAFEEAMAFRNGSPLSLDRVYADTKLHNRAMELLEHSKHLWDSRGVLSGIVPDPADLQLMRGHAVASYVSQASQLSAAIHKTPCSEVEKSNAEGRLRDAQVMLMTLTMTGKSASEVRKEARERLGVAQTFLNTHPKDETAQRLVSAIESVLKALPTAGDTCFGCVDKAYYDASKINGASHPAEKAAANQLLKQARDQITQTYSLIDEALKPHGSRTTSTKIGGFHFMEEIPEALWQRHPQNEYIK